MDDADDDPDDDSEALPLPAPFPNPLNSIEQDDDELEVLDDGDNPLDEIMLGFRSGKRG